MVSAPESLHLNSRGWLGTLREENKVTSAIHRSWKKCCEKSKEKAGILISGLGKHYKASDMEVRSQRIGRIWTKMDRRTFYYIPDLKNIMSKGLGTGKQRKICRVGKGTYLAGALKRYRKSKDIRLEK